MRRNLKLVADDGERRAQITRPIDIMAYVFAGNATFTIEGRKSRFTYNVSKSEEKEDGSCVFFVKVLTGPNNTADYSYLGIVPGRHGHPLPAFKLTKKSTAGWTAPSVVSFRWMWNALVTKDEENLATMAFYHEGRCGRCGRPLTVPESVERGIGPDCAQIMLEAA